jgi:hypothetical protein
MDKEPFLHDSFWNLSSGMVRPIRKLSISTQPIDCDLGPQNAIYEAQCWGASRFFSNDGDLEPGI